MINRLVLIVFIFALWSCAGATPPTPDPTPEVIAITLSSETKLWTIPPNSADIQPLASLPAGTIVRVIRHSMRYNGFWLFIRTDGYEGYIEERYGILTIEQREQLK
ncbi:MAG: hypothetical protein LCH85_17300 [Chloroflexi bacterium]|nr:hypothetical protein [Chloroflexota bacterium]